jgi:hypothetical protein
MAMKHGFASVEEYKAGVQKKFSLLETGIIHKPSTRLLLINVRSLSHLLWSCDACGVLTEESRARLTASCRSRTR